MSANNLQCFTCHVLIPLPHTLTYTTLCCSRRVCDACVSRLPQLLQLCPYCQASRGVWELPPYKDEKKRRENGNELPEYDELYHDTMEAKKMQSENEKACSAVHYVRPTDTVVGLALTYNVNVGIQYQCENLFGSDIVSELENELPGTFLTCVARSHTSAA